MVMETALAMHERGTRVLVAAGEICPCIKERLHRLSNGQIITARLGFMDRNRGFSFLFFKNIRALHNLIVTVFAGRFKDSKTNLFGHKKDAFGPVFIHAFNYRAGITAWLAAEFYNKKNWFVTATAVGYGMEKLIPILPFKVAAVSDYQARLIKEKSFFTKPGVIENRLVDVKETVRLYKNRKALRKELLQKFNWPDNAVIACTVAGHYPFKGTLLLPEAVKPVSGLYLVIQGSGPMKGFVEEKINFMGLKERVKLLDESLDRLALMAGADIFLHLPESETYCIALIEAMSLGCVPVVSKRGAMPGIIKQAGFGITVNPDDLSQTVKALKSLVYNFSDKAQEERLKTEDACHKALNNAEHGPVQFSYKEIHKLIHKKALELFKRENYIKDCIAFWSGGKLKKNIRFMSNRQLSLKAVLDKLFFVQKRKKKHNMDFYIYKLRTMILKAPKDSTDYKDLPDFKGLAAHKESTDKNDPRITRAGRFLRKYSIDEIPQILNVLKGHISLIGPRPDTPAQTLAMEPEARRLRLMCDQGITGLAQVSGRSLLNPSQRLALDIFYSVNRSSFLNIYVIIKSVVSF
jgi:lipopolysaccharide/colanic/teichoic acid biosynthesis glycosyltransferase/glycosyltransferase involved in cell wall biosynthesis